jgi:hypothetical protein
MLDAARTGASHSAEAIADSGSTTTSLISAEVSK